MVQNVCKVESTLAHDACQTEPAPPQNNSHKTKSELVPTIGARTRCTARLLPILPSSKIVRPVQWVQHALRSNCEHAAANCIKCNLG